jgi:hypothetical protein
MRGIATSVVLIGGVLAASAAMAQMDHVPKTKKTLKTFGVRLPRDHASRLFSDKD